jgi:hypothetical protein
MRGSGPCRARDSRDRSCSGLQLKWVRTAINGNLGRHYLHLSIPPGQDSVQLRLQSMVRDCNQRRWDDIICDSSASLPSACPEARRYACVSGKCLGDAPVSESLDLDMRVSQYASIYPIGTPKLSRPRCVIRVDPKKTEEREGQARLVCWVALFRCR